MLMKKIVIFFLFLFISFTSNAESLTVSDIKVEGLQRIAPGLVFNNIPFEIDDPIDDINFSNPIGCEYCVSYHFIHESNDPRCDHDWTC